MRLNQNNNIHRYLVLILCVVNLQGCLKFGDDIETSTPTADQVSACRTAMYISTSVKITPLGYKLSGSGIDDAIWLKFKTDSTELSQIFDTAVVDVGNFHNDFVFFNDLKGVKWWDVKDKMLIGGQVTLPDVKYMNVGAEKISDGLMIYIMWHET